MLRVIAVLAALALGGGAVDRTEAYPTFDECTAAAIAASYAQAQFEASCPEYSWGWYWDFCDDLYQDYMTAYQNMIGACAPEQQ